MNQALAVQIAQRIQNRPEHVARFRGSQAALRKNLGKIFFGALHDHIEKVHVRQAGAAALIQLKQIGMREFGSAAPQRELEIRGGAFGNQLDHGFGRLRAGELGEENGGFAGGTQVFHQRKRIVDDLAFVLFPGKAHHHTSSRRVQAAGKCGHCIRPAGLAWARWRLGRGWIVKT